MKLLAMALHLSVLPLWLAWGVCEYMLCGIYMCSVCMCPLGIHFQPHYWLDLYHGAAAALPLLGC